MLIANTSSSTSPARHHHLKQQKTNVFDIFLLILPVVSSSSDEEDDEDLGFEDVVPATGSGVGTPASSASANGQETKSLVSGLASALKKSHTGTGSSNGGTSTGAASPVTGPQTPDSSGRAAKKVRIEEPIAKDEEESEEDIEFEDV